MSGNIVKSADKHSDAVAVDFRIVVFSVPEDPGPLAQALMALPHMDMPTAKLQTHLLPGIIPHSYSQGVAVGVAVGLVLEYPIGHFGILAVTFFTRVPL